MYIEDKVTWTCCRLRLHGLRNDVSSVATAVSPSTAKRADRRCRLCQRLQTTLGVIGVGEVRNAGAEALRHFTGLYC